MISPKWASFIQAAAYRLQIKTYYSVEVHLQVFPSAVRAFCSSVKYYAECTRNLNNYFNSQWTKPRTSKIYSILHSFSKFLSQSCDKSSLITPKKISHGSLRK